MDHEGSGTFDCLTWAAVIYCTTVKDRDGDGLLDVWESSEIPPVDPLEQPLPNLKAMERILITRTSSSSSDTCMPGIIRPTAA